MSSAELDRLADIMTELTLRLFQNCREREARHAQKFGVAIAEFRCLRILYIFKSLSMNQLAGKMGLTCSRLTRIVDGLVDKKLMKREMNQNDRRAINISLSV